MSARDFCSYRKKVFKIGFVYLQKIYVIRFSLHFAHNNYFNNSLTERSLIIPCRRLNEMSRIPFFSILQLFFSLSSFVVNFLSLMSGSREIDVFPRKPFHIYSIFFDLLRTRCI